MMGCKDKTALSDLEPTVWGRTAESHRAAYDKFHTWCSSCQQCSPTFTPWWSPSSLKTQGCLLWEAAQKPLTDPLSSASTAPCITLHHAVLTICNICLSSPRLEEIRVTGHNISHFLAYQSRSANLDHVILPKCKVHWEKIFLPQE